MARLNVAADIELYYQLGGAATEETIVFVNGLTVDTSAWNGVATAFADSYRTLVYDCRGQGQSDKPPGPYSPTQHAADLKSLLNGLKLEKVHLVGLSNGGLIAMIVAGELSTAAQRILSLSVIDSFVHVDPMLKLIVESWKAALNSGGAALRFDVATPWVWGHSFVNQHAAEIAAFREQAAAADPEIISYLLDGLLSFGNAHKSLRSYEGPLLAIVGQEDILTPLRYSHEIVEWARYGMLVTVDHAGHAAPIERPEAVSKILRGFIARHKDFMTPLWGETEDSYDPS